MFEVEVEDDGGGGGSGRNRGRGDEEVGRNAGGGHMAATLYIALSCVKHRDSVLCPTFLVYTCTYIVDVVLAHPRFRGTGCLE